MRGRESAGRKFYNMHKQRPQAGQIDFYHSRVREIFQIHMHI